MAGRRRPRSAVALVTVLALGARVAGADEEPLVVLATDAGGVPIPRAHVTLEARDATGRWIAFRSRELTRGRAAFDDLAWMRGPGFHTFALEVYGARAADGSPLPLAPARVVGDRPTSGVATLRMGPGTSTRGRVVDAEGRGQADLIVVATQATARWGEPPTPGRGDVHAEGRTAADGAFELVGLDRRSFEFWVFEPSGDLASPAPTPGRGADDAVTLVRRPVVRATFRVVDGGGEPVRRAGVLARPQGSPTVPMAHRSGRTDDAGRVTLTGLDPSASYHVDVDPPDDRDDLAQVGVADVEPTDRDIPLPRGFRLRGTVVGASGRPVAAVVRVRHARGTHRLPTERDGTFSLAHLPWGEVSALATIEPVAGPGADTDAPDVPPSAWTRVSPDAPRVRLVARPRDPNATSRTVRVRVRGPDGSVPTTVAVRVEAPDRYVTMWRPARGLVVDAPRAPTRVTCARPTDAHGAALPWAPRTVDVPIDADEVDVELPAGRAIAGRVVDAAGAPLPAVPVFASAHGSFRSVDHEPDAEAVSALDGTFSLVGLAPGAYVVRTRANTLGPASRPVVAATDARDVALVVRRRDACVVRLVDSAGSAVVGAQFTLMEHEPAEPPRTGRGGRASSVVHVKSGADGVVRVPPLDPDLDLSLEVTPPSDRGDLAPLALDPWTPTAGDLHLPRGFVATVRVVDEDGRPRRATVHRWVPPKRVGFDLGGWASVDPPDAAGRHVIRALPIEGARFQAVAHGGFDFAREGVGPAPDFGAPMPPATTERAGERPVTLFPDVSAWVEATPASPDVVLTLPTRGVPMTIRAAGARAGVHFGWLFADLHGSVALKEFGFDTDGSATLEGVVPGAYHVLVRAPDHPDAPVGRVDVADFRGDAVVVPLAAGATLTVRVRNPGALLLSGWVRHAGVPVAILEPAGHGRLWVSGLPAGRYPISVWGHAGTRRLEADVDVETGIETPVDLVPVPDR